MLKSLYIKNFALIDEIFIDFNEGFNVFTGETGAGKSIIIEAISFLLRGKADLSVIKSGCEKAIIEGVFQIDDKHQGIRSKLEEEDIEIDDEVIVKRVIGKDKSSIKINQSSVTLGFLSDLFSSFVDIHSQRDSQYLFNKKNHIKLLDSYIGNSKEYFDYKKSYSAYNEAVNDYEDFAKTSHSESELEYLAFQLNEIRSAKLTIEEEEELIEIEKIYKSSEKYINSLQETIDLYNGNGGVREKLHNIIKLLDLDDNELSASRAAIETAYYTLEEEIDKTIAFYDRISQNDIDIEKVEERLYTYNKLKRKYGKDIDGLNEFANAIEKQINENADREATLKDKLDKVNEAKNFALKKAKELSLLRLNMAKKLEESIVKETKDLVLNNVVFKTIFKEKDLSNDGIDDIEFHVSMNKGENLKPMKDVASGGEMSRLMLALKTVFCSLNNTSLIIFDEIDSGVSGNVAFAVGKKMAKIGKDLQVLSITHSAPVAACASSHFFIYKNSDNTRTSTSIKKLNRPEIIAELASISSSSNKESALKAAEELYNEAQEGITNA